MAELTFVAPHRISSAQFVRVLWRANSPAAPHAAALAEIPGVYGLDRGVALAFFAHESTYGKAGICANFDTKNWGNVRRPYDPAAATIINPPLRGPFAKFPSWAAGLDDWCQRIKFVYVQQWGLHTVAAALVKYAPSSDGNRPERYAAAVARHVADWQREDAASEVVNGPLYDSPLGPTRTLPIQQLACRIIAMAGRANVRQGPGVAFPIAATLASGEHFTADAVLLNGAPVSGDPRWVHLADGRGFVHHSVVEVL